MRKFTSGKWEASKGMQYQHKFEIWTVPEHEKDMPLRLAIVTSNERIGHEEIAANARLMASAPELYDWAESVSGYIMECAKIYKKFPAVLLDYAAGFQELSTRINTVKNKKGSKRSCPKN